jgi:lipopolysaccharide export LptBFGC system permease protein LptF
MTPEQRRNFLIACALAFLIVSVVLQVAMALTGVGQPLPELLAWWSIAAALIAIALK